MFFFSNLKPTKRLWSITDKCLTLRQILNVMNTLFSIYPLIFGLGWGEIVLIALVVLLLFGGKKIPELMKGLGKGVKSFKEGMSKVEDEVEEIKKDIKE